MKVLLTGAFGNVGLSTLEELIKKGYDVRVFDVKTKKNVKISRRYERKVEIIWGDLRNQNDVERAVERQNVVIHVAAIIPPLADRNPKFAEEVNVGGTSNIIKAMEKQPDKPKLIYTSSIAIYGDRRQSPLIKHTDPPNPNPDDEYAKQKLKCENLIKHSKLKWVIFRLTYIVSPDKIKMDPLMFKMPLDTYLEICHTRDVGTALTNAIESDEIWGKVMHIAGGEECRLTYREYINRMMDIFGLGKSFLPDEVFSKENFHCGFMTTEESQKALDYQKHSMEHYFNEVKKKVGVKRYFMKMLKPLIRMYLLRNSSYYKEFLRGKK
ncbi:MAG: NAD(P)-dependent oxidoreductase [Thermotogae bacterium]|nr:NAD(P)-dependent oxidoreductase [Thermotogota bacterium]